MSWEMRKEAKMNEENLVPNFKRTPSERRRNATKAGKASGAARRRRRTLKDGLKALLVEKDLNGKTVQENIELALIDAARKGDVKAFLAIRDTIGEKPAEKIEAAMQPVRIIDTTGDGD